MTLRLLHSHTDGKGQQGQCRRLLRSRHFTADGSGPKYINNKLPPFQFKSLVSSLIQRTVAPCNKQGTVQCQSQVRRYPRGYPREWDELYAPYYGDGQERFLWQAQPRKGAHSDEAIAMASAPLFRVVSSPTTLTMSYSSMLLPFPSVNHFAVTFHCETHTAHSGIVDGQTTIEIKIFPRERELSYCRQQAL